MENQYVVYAHDISDEWLAAHEGVPDYRLVGGLSLEQATELRRNLFSRFHAEEMPVNFFVREEEVRTVPRETSQRPARRKLGMRET